MYGGRVIDDFDRRVVKTYMDEYMGDFIFDTFQPFHFYMGEEVDYFIPKPEKGRYQSHFISLSRPFIAKLFSLWNYSVSPRLWSFFSVWKLFGQPFTILVVKEAAL